MYENIAIAFYCFIISSFLIILIHDLGINASGYVFDTDPYDLCQKRWGYQLEFFSSEEEFWIIGFVIFGVLCGILAATVWPLSILSLLIFFVLRMARSIVRKGKKSLEDHVKNMHEQEE